MEERIRGEGLSRNREQRERQRFHGKAGIEFGRDGEIAGQALGLDPADIGSGGTG
jgi:hypothetical protein